ncbi:MAG: MBL fold metallo-hydrolase, partial [Bacteroidota bacterium]
MKTEIRMFKVGALGDCFLLSFIEAEEKFNILIDCGAYWNSEEAKTRLKLVAKEIQELVAPESLDIVVGTHQHNDHYSGFWFAKETFENIGAKQVWLSWMNEPGNEDAEAILAEHHNLRIALQNIRLALQQRGDQAGIALLEEVESLVDIHEDISTEEVELAARKRISVPDEGLKTIRNMGPETYLNPGEIKSIFEEKVKVYVLGPPKNYKSLRDTNPNKGQSYDKHLRGLNLQAIEVLKTIEDRND